MKSINNYNHYNFGLNFAIILLVFLGNVVFTSNTSLFPSLNVSANGVEVSSGVLYVSKLNFTDFGVAKGNDEFSDSPDDIHEFILTNNGSTPLNISEITITNQTNSNFFTIEENPSGTIESGGSRTLSIGFTRVAYGIGIAEINITSNDATTPNYSFFVKVDSQYCENCDNELHDGVMCEKCQPRFSQDSYPSCDVCVEANMVDNCTACRFPAADISNNCLTCTDTFRTPPRCIF